MRRDFRVIKSLPIRPIERLILRDVCAVAQYYKSRETMAQEYNISANYATKILTNLCRKGYIEQCGNCWSRRTFRATDYMQELLTKGHKMSKKTQDEDDFFVNLSTPSPDEDGKNNNEESDRNPDILDKETGKPVEDSRPIYINTKKKFSGKLNATQNKEEDTTFTKNSKVLSQEIFNIFAEKRNKQASVPTITKRVEVIKKFQQDFSDDDLITACRALAIMKKTAPTEAFKDGWCVNFSWLTNVRCLQDDIEYGKRVAWLEKGVCGDVEPDVSFVGLDAWNEWRKEH